MKSVLNTPPSAIKVRDSLVNIPLDDTCTLSVRYSLTLKENKGWLPKEFGSIPSNSLKLKLLSDCCIVHAHTAKIQMYLIVSPDPEKNKTIVLIVCDYELEDKPNPAMIATSQASLEFTPDDITNLFHAYDGKILTKVVEKGTGIPLNLHQDGPPMVTDVRMIHHQKVTEKEKV